MNRFIAIFLTFSTFAFTTRVFGFETKLIDNGDSFGVGCGQADDLPEDAPDYGDLICTIPGDGELVLRETVINNGASVLTIEVSVSGVNITGAYALNFGQVHGFTRSITLSKRLQEATGSVQAIVNSPDGPLRMFFEVYGIIVEENPEITFKVTK